MKTISSVWLLVPTLLIIALSDVAQAKINIKKLERQNWAQVTTDNFTVISDQGEKTAFKLAEKLEMFRKTYGLIGSVPLPEDARPVKVISVKRSATYKMLGAGSKNLKRTSGFFTDSISGNYAIVKSNRIDSERTIEQTTTSTLFHEYTHYLAANLSNVKLPYWYNEGLADYLSEVKFPDSSSIKLGLPINYHLRSLHHMKWQPIEKILKTTYVSYKNSDDRYRIYTQGWLMIHYFKSDVTRNKQLTTFLDSLHKGRNIDDAFQESFEMSYNKLDRLLKQHMAKPEFEYSLLQLKKPWDLQNFVSKKLKPENILFELGEVLLNARHEHSESQRLFERAIEINPKHASALAGLANIHMVDDLERANTLITQAKNAEPDNTWVSTIAGHINARYAKTAEEEKERIRYWNQAVKSFNHAINSGDINLEAIDGAARLYLESGELEKAKELFEYAFDFAPSNYRLRTTLIRLYLMLGDVESAEKIVQRVKRNNHMSEAGMTSFNNWLDKLKSKLKASQSVIE